VKRDDQERQRKYTLTRIAQARSGAPAAGYLAFLVCSDGGSRLFPESAPIALCAPAASRDNRSFVGTRSSPGPGLPQTRIFQPLNPKPSTLDIQPSTLDPQPFQSVPPPRGSTLQRARQSGGNRTEPNQRHLSRATACLGHLCTVTGTQRYMSEVIE
jgi:hypothetical protein